MSMINSIVETLTRQQLSEAQYNVGSAGDTGFYDILQSTSVGVTEDMDAIFAEAAEKYQISEELLKAVAKAESNFNTNAVSSAGAMGVMQLMPGTAKSLGVTNPFDARQNIMGGAKYLKENLEKFGSVELALAAYNAGPGRVQRSGGNDLPEETVNYVSKVMSYLQGGSIYANKSVQSSYAAGLMSGTGSYSGLGITSGLGSWTSYASLLSVLAGQQDGESTTMDKDTLYNYIQIMRMQMMMSAGQIIGDF